MPGADFNDATNETAKAWQALSQEQRRVYQEQAEKEREAYKAANKVYQDRKAAQQQVCLAKAVLTSPPGLLPAAPRE